MAKRNFYGKKKSMQMLNIKINKRMFIVGQFLRLTKESRGSKQKKVPVISLSSAFNCCTHRHRTKTPKIIHNCVDLARAILRGFLCSPSNGRHPIALNLSLLHSLESKSIWHSQISLCTTIFVYASFCADKM